jgi:hypothetical protein
MTRVLSQNLWGECRTGYLLPCDLVQHVEDHGREFAVIGSETSVAQFERCRNKHSLNSKGNGSTIRLI